MENYVWSSEKNNIFFFVIIAFQHWVIYSFFFCWFPLGRKVYYCYFFIKFIRLFFVSLHFLLSLFLYCLWLKRLWPFINNLVNNILLVSVFNRFFFYCLILILINCLYHVISTEHQPIDFKLNVSLKNNKTWLKK